MLDKFNSLKDGFENLTSKKAQQQVSILDNFSDARIDKCVKRMSYTEEEITVLYTIFNSFDKEGLGYITTDDFFAAFLQEKRTAFGDSVLQLMQIKDMEMITFGEYMDIVSSFSLFEEKEVLSLAFIMFDPERTGFVDKDELRFFIYSQHNDDQGSNIERGLKYLEDNDDGDGRFEFYQIQDMHKNFQQLFYPCFKLQIALKRNCGLGERWWELKAYQLLEEKLAKRKAADAKEQADTKNAAMASEIEIDSKVQERMGTVKYYLMPWQRKKVKEQIARIAAINAELERQEKEEKSNPKK